MANVRRKCVVSAQKSKYVLKPTQRLVLQVFVEVYPYPISLEQIEVTPELSVIKAYLDVVELGPPVVWNAAGIVVLSAVYRKGTEHDLVHNIHVHDNTVLGTNSTNNLENHLALAWLELPSTTLLDPANKQSGANDEYWYTSPEGSLERFRWGEKSISKLAEFNATPGEENGRYLTQAEKDSLVANRKIPAEPEQRQ